MARTGNFSRAARGLGVSQPAVHRATKELAALARIDLFDRTRGGVVLTQAAEVLAHEVRLAFAEYRQAVFEVTEYLGQGVTRINIGCMPLTRTAIVPAAIDRLLRDVGARVQVNCVDARYQSLLRDLRFGDLYLLIGALRYPVPPTISCRRRCSRICLSS